MEEKINEDRLEKMEKMENDEQTLFIAPSNNGKRGNMCIINPILFSRWIEDCMERNVMMEQVM